MLPKQKNKRVYNSMITFIITTSFILDPSLCENLNENLIPHLLNMRYVQYLQSIPRVIQFAKELGARVIVVENNGYRETFFDTLGCEVLYTNHNIIQSRTKGIKELLDIWACIEHFKIPDEEFIVKVSGRYAIDFNGNFCKELRKYNPETTDCILRYGWFGDMSNEEPHDNCLTGLIGMKCKYVKQIQHNDANLECVETNWARVSLQMEPSRVIPIKGSIGYRMYEWNTFDYKDL